MQIYFGKIRKRTVLALILVQTENLQQIKESFTNISALIIFNSTEIQF